MEQNLISKLLTIQAELKAPKSQYNSFGKYKYRSCEDILEAVKPLLFKNQLLMSITDEAVLVGDRVYIKASITITDGKETLSNTAYAREEFEKKGMDASQITGAASSYARKYALNGLFCIDDTKDADATNTHEQQSSNDEYNQGMKELSLATTVEELKKVWSKYKSLQNNEAFKKAKDIKKKAISEGL